MANNYLQFSLAVGLRTDEEVAWCTNMLGALNDILNDEAKDDDGTVQQARHEFEEFIQKSDGNLDFEWQLEPGTSRDDRNFVKVLWIHAEEGGNPDQVADFLQKFIRKFRPQDGMWFPWSESCSAMRVNEFGGGAVAITAEKQEFFIPQIQAQKFLEAEGMQKKESNLYVKELP